MLMSKPFVQPSVMTTQEHFAQAPSASIPRSTFDRSHAVKTTIDGGFLYPIFLDEVVPGDTFDLSTTAFARLATPLRPVMDNAYLDVHYFFVPNRLLYNRWEEFMGERKNPDDDPNEVSVPTVPWNPPAIADNVQNIGYYFGLPRKRSSTVTTQPLQVSVLPFRAYRLIWNEWYRDENLQAPLPFTDGEYNATYDYIPNPVRRGKRHDYFTSCLPWPQKGDPVHIPISPDVPVMGYRDIPLADSQFVFNRPGSGLMGINMYGEDQTNGYPTYYTTSVWPGDTTGDNKMTTNPNVRIGTAKLATATTVTINELRTAFQIQTLLERDARGGTRYIELILSHFGVRSDDARLQRPEYLGGGTTRVNINPLPSTATVPTQAPQGNLSGVGTAVGDARFTKSFTEHGIIIGLVSARADLTYQRGVDRMWTRRTRYDYYWPALAHLGEQAVLQREIHYTGNEGNDSQVFGYQERYAEYRYKPSMITGLFNSWCAQPLDTWHLSQKFDESDGVYLNEDFIEENPPFNRISAVPSEPDFLLDVWHDLKTTRPMPVYSVPGLGATL